MCRSLTVTKFLGLCIAVIVSSRLAWGHCTLRVDKQVSCDGGVTFVDQGYGDGVVGTCTAAKNEPDRIVVRYLVTNDASSGVFTYNCTVKESNSQIYPTPLVINTPSSLNGPLLSPIAPGETRAVTLAPKTCTDTLAAGEPDTATLSCTCASDGSVTPSADSQLTDTAAFSCTGGGGGGSGCLTYTPGFWGTHPEIAQMFLPLKSCGLTITSTQAGANSSSTEDMCYGNDFITDKANTSPQQLQLARQCMAATLNVAASSRGGGNCDATQSTAGVNALINRCCNTLCPSGAMARDITASGCIDALDAFNNSADTLATYGPFVNPGPANSTQCSAASGNGFVNRPALSGDARTYGPR